MPLNIEAEPRLINVILEKEIQSFMPTTRKQNKIQHSHLNTNKIKLGNIIGVFVFFIRDFVNGMDYTVLKSGPRGLL